MAMMMTLIDYSMRYCGIRISVINGVAGDQDNDENMGDSDSYSGKVSLYSVYSVQEDS